MSAPGADVRLSIAGLPAVASRVLVRHYRIDDAHSNARTVWKQLGSPQNPTPDQYAQLERAYNLQLLDSLRWMGAPGGKLDLAVLLPRQGVSLVLLKLP